MTVTFLQTPPTVISACTVVSASAQDVYALVSNPARHHQLDGGGNVIELRAGKARRVEVGDTFTQSMKLGIPYTMTSTVTRADPPHAVTWSMPTGHTWAWEIEDNGDGTVTVTETFDATHAKAGSFALAPVFKALGSFARNRKNIALSLSKLQRTFS